MSDYSIGGGGGGISTIDNSNMPVNYTPPGGTWTITAALVVNGDVTPNASNNHDLGTSTLSWGMIAARNFGMQEQTSPPTGVSGSVYVYMKENGSAKQELIVKFEDDSTSVLATQA